MHVLSRKVLKSFIVPINRKGFDTRDGALLLYRPRCILANDANVPHFVAYGIRKKKIGSRIRRKHDHELSDKITFKIYITSSLPDILIRIRHRAEEGK